MSEKINMDELKAMIANEIRSEGFNEILDSMNIEVLGLYQESRFFANPFFV